jgi:hypothetical protein
MARLATTARALVLAFFALAPLFAATYDVRLSDLHTAAAEGAALRSEPVQSPATTFAVGTPDMQTAVDVARAHWGGDPCGGQIEVLWTPADAEINATSSWTNPKSAYDDPGLNGDCRVAFNPNAQFDWDKFCTVMVHEYGHLAGRPHAEAAGDVMAAYYTQPLTACQTATPSAFRVSAPSTASIRTATTARRGAAKSAPARKTRAKRAAAKRKARGSKAAKKRSKRHAAKRKSAKKRSARRS